MGNENRALATVQRIKEIHPIENSDNLSRAVVLGWNVVVRRGDYEPGDKVVYFEIDSFLPVRECFEFLRARSYRNNEHMGEGFLVKTMRLRGVVSQGLVFSLDALGLSEDLPVGKDLTSDLGVRLWDVPQPVGESVSVGGFHPVISKTDEIRAQSDESYIRTLTGHPYYVSEKIDGMSVTVVKEGSSIHVYTRNQEIQRSEGNVAWSTLERIGVLKVLEESPTDIGFQGELYGPGIQKNRLRMKDTDWRFFNIVNPSTGEYYSFKDWDSILETVDPGRVLRHVKILETGEEFRYSLQDLKDMTVGDYDGAGQREGIVIRPQSEMLTPQGRRLSFKVINESYLLKNDR